MNITKTKFDEIENKYDTGITREKTRVVARVTLENNAIYYVDENKDVFERIVGEYYKIEDESIISRVKEVLLKKSDKYAFIDEEITYSTSTENTNKENIK